jgi:iron(III) transport system permease protein
VNGELTMAMVETVVLASASLLFLWILRRFERGREFAAVGKGIGATRREITAPWARALVGTIGVGGVGILLLPHLTLVLVSLVPEGSWTTQILPPRYSFENYASLFANSELWTPVLNSLRMAALATAGNLLFCFVLAYLLVRGSFRGKGGLNFLMMLPWALPGTVIAMALATTFSANQPWFGRFVLVGTFWILPLAYFIRNIPLVAQAATASFRQYDFALEEAAHSLGASWTTTMRRIAAPLVLPGLAAGGLLAFVANACNALATAGPNSSDHNSAIDLTAQPSGASGSALMARSATRSASFNWASSAPRSDVMTSSSANRVCASRLLGSPAMTTR